VFQQWKEIQPREDDKMKKPIIKGRTTKATFAGEHSTIDYHITASCKIVREIHDAIQQIERKYPKTWERDNQ